MVLLGRLAREGEADGTMEWRNIDDYDQTGIAPDLPSLVVHPVQLILK